MSKRMLVDGAHPEEIRVVVTSGNRLDEYDIETTFKKQVKGNIYLAKVTRVEPSLQAAFVDFGGNRHGFLAFSEIHPDYYQIPMEDRQALIDEQEELERQARAAREHLEDIDGDIGEDGDNVDASGEDDNEDGADAQDGADDDDQDDGSTDEGSAVKAEDGDNAEEADPHPMTTPMPATQKILTPPMTPTRLPPTRMSKRRWKPLSPHPPAGHAGCGATKSRKLSSVARSCWCKSSRKNAATRAPR